jgi:hypothetical protein
LKKAVPGISQAPMLTEAIRAMFDKGVTDISKIEGVSVLSQTKSENKNFGTPTILVTDISTFQKNKNLSHGKFQNVTSIYMFKKFLVPLP